MFKMIYNTFISFLLVYKDFGDGIQSTEGLMLRGSDEYVILDE
jgi:hypothetical protein